jgi:hypothetical protein
MPLTTLECQVSTLANSDMRPRPATSLWRRPHPRGRGQGLGARLSVYQISLMQGMFCKVIERWLWHGAVYLT